MKSVSAVSTVSPAAVARSVTDKDAEIARRAGWQIVNFPFPENTSTDYYVAKCDGVYGQSHFGIIKDLSAPCTICKMMVAVREKQCAQHIYIEGRRTFEFICVRGHHYLASSNKKALPRCPVCTIEDDCKKRGRTITFDGECTYVNQDSLMRYRCTACDREHYISGSKWALLFSEKGKKRTTYRSVIDWCQNGEHRIPDKNFCSVVDSMRICEQLFNQRFDDCDDMVAANNKFLNGIYFTGFNRKLGIGIVHVLDSFYIKDNVPLINWCVLRDIKLIIIDVRDVYESALTTICKSVIRLNIPTRFDHLLVGECPSDVTPEFYRATKLCACMLIEGCVPLANRMVTK